MQPIDLAEILVETLNDKSAYEFSQDFTAIRSYVPYWELKDLRELRVTVLVPSWVSSRHDRGRWLAEVTVQIGVQVKLEVPPSSDAADAAGYLMTAADPYQTLLYDISAVLRDNPHQGEANLMTITEIPYDSDHIQQNVYTGLINLTYQMIRG